MSDFIPEEMLSAYLDNELSEEEHARVERHLEEHAESRKLVAEIAEVREAIQKLPRHSVSSNFTASVMQRLADDAPQSDHVSMPGTSSRQHRMRWAATLAAIAASILLAMLAVDFYPGSRVAKNEPDDALPQAASRSLDENQLTDLGMADTEIDFGRAQDRMKVITEKSATPPVELVERVDSLDLQRSMRMTVPSSEAAPPEIQAELAVSDDVEGMSEDATLAKQAPSDLIPAMSIAQELEYNVEASQYEALTQLVTMWEAGSALAQADPDRSRRMRASVAGGNVGRAELESMETKDGEIVFVTKGTPQAIATLLSQIRVPLSASQAEALGIPDGNALASDSIARDSFASNAVLRQNGVRSAASRGASALESLERRQLAQQPSSVGPQRTSTQPPNRYTVSPSNAIASPINTKTKMEAERMDAAKADGEGGRVATSYAAGKDATNGGVRIPRANTVADRAGEASRPATAMEIRVRVRVRQNARQDTSDQ